MKNKFLAVDVGNTSTLLALYSGSRVIKTFRVPTREYRTHALRSIRDHFPVKKIEAVVVASVVPAVSRHLKKSLPAKLGLRTLVIGRDIQVPIVNRYKNPKQVGIDRLMNGVAAFQKHKKESIVIDFGTAITFDVISRRGEYLGGVIAPGIEISLDALFQRTALLPKTKLSRPKNVLGRDTVESIRSGCSFGIGGLCDRVVQRIRESQKFNPMVIATGGYAAFMSHYCDSIDTIDPELTLKGIILTHRKFLKSA